MQSKRLAEIFLAETIVYVLLWLTNDYLATLLSVVFAGIFLFILLISLLAEWIERSGVPRSYYGFMVVSILSPLLTAALMLAILGIPEWLSQ
jgi:hypothetical protein